MGDGVLLFCFCVFSNESSLARVMVIAPGATARGTVRGGGSVGLRLEAGPLGRRRVEGDSRRGLVTEGDRRPREGQRRAAGKDAPGIFRKLNTENT